MKRLKWKVVRKRKKGIRKGNRKGNGKREERNRKRRRDKGNDDKRIKGSYFLKFCCFRKKMI